LGLSKLNLLDHRNLRRASPTTAQRIALVIDQARRVPTISEFGVYDAQ